MAENIEDEDLDRDLEKVTSLYARIPEQEFSAEITAKIKRSAENSVRKQSLLRTLSHFFGWRVGNSNESSRRFTTVTSGLAFIAVFGIAGLFYFQSQPTYQPLILTASDLNNPLLRDAAQIVVDLQNAEPMQAAVNNTDNESAEFLKLVNSLSEKKDKLLSAAEILAQENRKAEAENLREAIAVIDSQIDALTVKEKD